MLSQSFKVLRSWSGNEHHREGKVLQLFRPVTGMGDWDVFVFRMPLNPAKSSWEILSKSYLGDEHLWRPRCSPRWHDFQRWIPRKKLSGKHEESIVLSGYDSDSESHRRSTCLKKELRDSGYFWSKCSKQAHERGSSNVYSHLSPTPSFWLPGRFSSGVILSRTTVSLVRLFFDVDDSSVAKHENHDPLPWPFV